jgi:hypothetical protein
MARGYLGKISAIVSANTGDYVRKLDDSAKRTAAFARTIQNDLNRASRDASKSIDAILTPLQRFERAIQNAAGARLRFRGVDVAINNVRELSALVSRLEQQRDIDFAVRASGLRNITELKQTLQSISQDSYEIVARVGLQGLREARAQLDTLPEDTTVTVRQRVQKSAEYDAAIAAYERLGGEKRVQALISVVGADQLERAVTAERQLVSVAEQLANPAAAATKQYQALSAELQIAFGPALERAQKGVFGLRDAIEQGGTVSERRFDGVRQRVEQTTQAIERLTEAQRLANTGATGQELAFRAPRVQEELIASGGVAGRVASLPAAAREDPSIRNRIEELARLRQEIARYQASVERRQLLGLDTRGAEQALDRVIAKSKELRESFGPGEQVETDSLIAREQAQKRLSEQLAADTDRRVKAETDALIAREQAQKRLAEQLAAAAERTAKAETDALIAREQSQKRLAEQLAAAAEQAAKAETDALIAREQAQKRLSEQLAADTDRRVKAETDALISREQAQKRLSEQLAADTDRRVSVETDALIAREQAQKRLAEQLAASAEQAARAETDALIAREQAQKRLSEQLAADTDRRVKAETDALIAREQAQKRLAEQLAAAAEQASRAETDALIAREQAQKRLSEQLAADTDRRVRIETDALIAREQAQKRLAEQLAASAEQAARAETDALIAREQRALRLEQQLATDAARRQQQEIDSLIAREQAALRLAEILDDQNPASRVERSRTAEETARRRREEELTAAAGSRTDVGQNRARNRILQNLGGEIDVVRRRLRELPDIGATLGPGVDNLNNRFRLLARQGVAFTAEQARELQRQIAAVTAALNTRASLGQQFLGQFGGEGIAGLGLGVDQQSLRAAGGQIEFVQQRLSRLAAEARGPTLQALENFRQVAQRLFDAGTIDTESGRAELAALRRELAATLSAAGGGSQGRILGDLNRSGDIARGGIDRFSLGLQQAAFAVDDFFSVTGGFEQRIRAIGNNLTQLGFIVGGTSGLFVALGVSVGAQAIAGIVRFINSGQAAEDQTKALNDALERQKSLADQLAQSFSNLADAITTRGFSSAAKEARQLTRDLESLIKVQRDAREERLVSANPRGREIDGQINSLNRRLRDVTDAGQAAALRDQIGGLQDERRRLRQELPNRPTPTRTEVANSIGFRGFQSTASLLQGVVLDTIGTIASFGVNQIVNSGQTTPRIGADAARAAGAIDPNNTAAIRAAIDARIQQINPIASQDIGLVSTFDGNNRNILAAREERARLEELRARFNDSAFDDALRGYIESVNTAARDFEAAQNEVTQSIESGVPGARELGVIIDTLSQQIDNANNAIQSAIDEFNANPTAQGAAERRDAILARQQDVIDRTRAQRSAVEAESDRLRRERTLNPSRQIEAVIGRTQDAIDRIGSAAGFQQARLRDLQFQRETVQQQLRAAPADPVLIRTEQDLNNAIRSLEAEVTALDETMNGFEAREARRLLGDPERGRQLAMTPGERAAEETQQGINDIIARFGEIAAETTGLVDVRARDEAINRFLGDRIRQEAPLIAGFSDEVANALLQGPSRAALQASDASTLQGQQELNRLLRGEDPARDVNLVELQKQTQALNELVQIGRAGPQVAQ